MILKTLLSTLLITSVSAAGPLARRCQVSTGAQGIIDKIVFLNSTTADVAPLIGQLGSGTTFDEIAPVDVKLVEIQKLTQQIADEYWTVQSLDTSDCDMLAVLDNLNSYAVVLKSGLDSVADKYEVIEAAGGSYGIQRSLESIQDAISSLLYAIGDNHPCNTSSDLTVTFDLFAAALQAIEATYTGLNGTFFIIPDGWYSECFVVVGPTQTAENTLPNPIITPNFPSTTGSTWTSSGSNFTFYSFYSSLAPTATPTITAAPGPSTSACPPLPTAFNCSLSAALPSLLALLEDLSNDSQTLETAMSGVTENTPFDDVLLLHSLGEVMVADLTSFDGNLTELTRVSVCDAQAIVSAITSSFCVLSNSLEVMLQKIPVITDMDAFYAVSDFIVDLDAAMTDLQSTVAAKLSCDVANLLVDPINNVIDVLQRVDDVYIGTQFLYPYVNPTFTRDCNAPIYTGLPPWFWNLTNSTNATTGSTGSVGWNATNSTSTNITSILSSIPTWNRTTTGSVPSSSVLSSVPTWNRTTTGPVPSSFSYSVTLEEHAVQTAAQLCRAA